MAGMEGRLMESMALCLILQVGGHRLWLDLLLYEPIRSTTVIVTANPTIFSVAASPGLHIVLNSKLPFAQTGCQ